ncbi:MAG: helix-turn-helix transcriptional regulator [Deltaproteobacteria bacterium]|nr:helix-turn-helix transcriptional regulator [Deltaproteobacteria bacterium]
MKGVPIILQKETPEIRKLLIEILRRQREVAFVSSGDELNEIIEERGINLLLGISRVEKSQGSLTYLPIYHPAVLRAIGYLKEHSSESVTLQSLATYAHLSKFRLCHLFKQQTTKSAKTYLTFLRISRAKELLKQQTMSISEVGQTVGFHDPSHFAKAFLRLEGFSPSAYRTGLSHKASSWTNLPEWTGRHEKARIDKKKARTA